MARQSKGVVVIDKWLRRPQVLISAFVFLVTLGVYVATLNPTTPFAFMVTSHDCWSTT